MNEERAARLGQQMIGAPAAAVFTVIHGAGNGVLTIAKGTRTKRGP